MGDRSIASGDTFQLAQIQNQSNRDYSSFRGIDEAAELQFNQEKGAEVPASDGKGESHKGVDPGSD